MEPVVTLTLSVGIGTLVIGALFRIRAKRKSRALQAARRAKYAHNFSAQRQRTQNIRGRQFEDLDETEIVEYNNRDLARNQNIQFLRLLVADLFDGEKLGVGNIIAASFTNQKKTFDAVRYTNKKGQSDYYTPEGFSMRKTFLRTPLDIFRISSGFNLRRKHPIHKKIKAHRGVDYSAPRGTPVYAAGAGKVIESGFSKYNGNYVFIQHGQTYVTKYLHLNKRKVRRGQTVKQRQLIGTVGSTGYSTGNHLHYEFLVNGVHRNPRTVKLPQARPITANERVAFRQTVEPMLSQLAEYQDNSQLALVEGNSSNAN